MMNNQNKMDSSNNYNTNSMSPENSFAIPPTISLNHLDSNKDSFGILIGSKISYRNEDELKSFSV